MFANTARCKYICTPKGAVSWLFARTGNTLFARRACSALLAKRYDAMRHFADEQSNSLCASAYSAIKLDLYEAHCACVRVRMLYQTGTRPHAFTHIHTRRLTLTLTPTLSLSGCAVRGLGVQLNDTEHTLVHNAEADLSRMWRGLGGGGGGVAGEREKQLLYAWQSSNPFICC